MCTLVLGVGRAWFCERENRIGTSQVRSRMCMLDDPIFPNGMALSSEFRTPKCISAWIQMPARDPQSLLRVTSLPFLSASESKLHPALTSNTTFPNLRLLHSV
jgi:hypothetical protein